MITFTDFYSAPVDFVIEMNRTPMLIVCVVGVCTIFYTFWLLSVADGDQMLSIGINAVILVVALSAAIGLRFFTFSARVTEASMIGVFFFFATWHDYSNLVNGADNALLRHRTLQFACIFWNVFPALFNFRLHHSLAFLLWHTAQICICTKLQGEIYDEEVKMQFYSSPIVFGMCGFVLAFHSQRRLKLLYNARHQVAAEKEAVESLLSMVCEAAIWLAADGDTIVRCDHRFDLLMGRPMERAKLSGCMPADLSAQEQERLRAAFSKQCAGDHKTPVELLPARLQGEPGVNLGVDLFIVDRRATLCSNIMRLGFLVGIRVVSGAELTGLGMGGSPAYEVIGASRLGGNSDGDDADDGASMGSATVFGKSLLTQIFPKVLGGHTAPDATDWEALGAVPLPCDAEVLVGKIGGVLVSRSVSGLYPGDFIVCVDRRSIMSRSVKVVGVFWGSRLPQYTLGLTNGAQDSSAEVTLLAPCRLLIEPTSSRASWPGDMRHVANLSQKGEHAIFVFDENTVEVGCMPWRYHLATECALPQTSTKEACMLLLEEVPGYSNLGVCVRVLCADLASAPFVAVTGPLLADSCSKASSLGSPSVWSETVTSSMDASGARASCGISASNISISTLLPVVSEPHSSTDSSAFVLESL